MEPNSQGSDEINEVSREEAKAKLAEKRRQLEERRAERGRLLNYIS